MDRISYPMAAAALLAGITLTSVAAAEEPGTGTSKTTYGAPAAPVSGGDTVTYEQLSPNGALIASGSVLLGMTYGASVIVGATSDRSSDRHLLVPIAGPWINLADRDPCRVTREGCDGETTNKVLLVADGIFQGLGALQIVGGFLFPTRTTVTTAKGPSVRIAPTVGWDRYGLSASGTF